MTETIEHIFIEKITPNPDNRRVGGFDPVKLQQLADSIKEVGVQQPIIVRQQLANGGFQLVAGERRWRAAKLAGLTEIPAIVRELDDLQVLKISTIENLQREDVHPLDEADGYARLLDLAGYEVEQIAQELGKSASYVYQRLKLRELIPAARELFVAEKITAGHAILIARLPADVQEDVLENQLFEGYAENREAVSVRDLGQYIQRDVLMDLSKVSWKLDDANLVEEAGPCTLCPKRTGQTPALFADVCNGGKKDYCLDRQCFEAKAKAALAQRELQLSDEPLIRVSERWGVPNTVNTYDITPCKKGAKGAVRTLMVNGPRMGAIGWALPRGQAAERQAAKADPKEAERLRKERAAKILENKITRRTHRVIWETVTAAAQEDLKKRKDILPLPALRLVVGAFMRDVNFRHRGLLLKEVGQPLAADAKYGDLLMTLIQILVSPALDQDSTTDYELENAKKLAIVYGVDLKAIVREVKEELAKPKEKAPAKSEKKGKRDPEYVEMVGKPARAKRRKAEPEDEEDEFPEADDE
jgi:ParB/RepB/Spo0J family partition protein